MTTKTHSRTCLCPPPGSATWHCAHFVLKIFAPIRMKVKKKERDNTSVKRVACKNTKEGRNVTQRNPVKFSYPWRRLLRELLQTKPSDDDSFFLWFLSFPLCQVRSLLSLCVVVVVVVV